LRAKLLDQRRINLTPRMTGTGIVHRDEWRCYQACSQDRQIFACKHVEIRGQDSNHLACVDASRFARKILNF